MRLATVEDKYFTLRVAPLLAATMDAEEHAYVDMFNTAAVQAAAKSQSELPVTELVDMRNRNGFEFRYGIQPSQNGFTLASNELLVVVKGMARRMKIDVFPKTTVQPCLN